MAKAIEDLITAVYIDKFEAGLIQFKTYQEDSLIGTAVKSVITEITALKETKLKAHQPYDRLTDLLDELNELIEKGTESTIDTFNKKHNTTTCLTRCMTFFMPSEHYKLDQAVNQLILSLNSHPRILENTAKQTTRFLELLV